MQHTMFRAVSEEMFEIVDDADDDNHGGHRSMGIL